MNTTLEAHHFPFPSTGALLYSNWHHKPPRQRSWSNLAVYVDGLAYSNHESSEKEPGVTSEQYTAEHKAPQQLLTSPRSHIVLLARGRV